jgi:hypothetical protein
MKSTYGCERIGEVDRPKRTKYEDKYEYKQEQVSQIFPLSHDRFLFLYRLIVSLAKMKFQDVIILFTAAVSATGTPTCKGSSPSYCKYTSNRDATECRRLFGEAQSSQVQVPRDVLRLLLTILSSVKNYINVATCQLPAKTVTSTRTKCVTVVTTKTLAPPPTTTKIYTTITKTGKP